MDVQGKSERYGTEMPRYAAFLRGINLARNRRISSAELRGAFEDAGLEDVATFRTSGNVVFEGSGAPAALRARIEQALADATGHEVVVFLRAALATGEDRLAFGDRELYWLPSGGMRDAALDLQAIERLVGPTTMRTKGTMERLAAKLFAG